MAPFLPRPTHLLPASPSAISQAAEILRQGGLVAFPTETVYGLGGAADNPAAVRSIFAAKGRPADHPVIVHLADATELDAWAAEIPAEARQLAAAFWPGPMTLVLRRSERASDLVTGGLDTVGLRVPAHPVAQQLLREFGGAIAAPSANRFGRVSPTTAEHVRQELTGRIDLILDGGPCRVGLESTIIDCSRGQAAILRPGGVTAEQIELVLGRPLAAPTAGGPRVSGGLPCHYAPRARVEIVSPERISERAEQLAAEGWRVAVLGSAAPGGVQTPGVCHYLLPGGDAELARSLYAVLRQVDEDACDVVLTALPAEEGLGAAIADRLRKAAGPRIGNN